MPSGLLSVSHCSVLTLPCAYHRSLIDASVTIPVLNGSVHIAMLCARLLVVPELLQCQHYLCGRTSLVPALLCARNSFNANSTLCQNCFGANATLCQNSVGANAALRYLVLGLLYAQFCIAPTLLVCRHCFCVIAVFVSTPFLCRHCFFRHRFCADTAFASTPLLCRHCFCVNTAFVPMLLVPTLLLCRHCFCADTSFVATLLLCRDCVILTLLRSPMPDCGMTAVCEHGPLPQSLA